MKTKVERTVSWMLAVVLFVGFIGWIAAGEVRAFSLENELNEKIAFSDEVNKRRDQLFEHWNGVLPDYYAGTYIDGLEFYVLVTCDPKQVEDEILCYMQDINLSIRQVKYSYNYLSRVRDSICENVLRAEDRKTTNKAAIIGVGINEIANRITVEVLNKYHLSDEDVFSLVGTEQEIDIIRKDEEYKEYTAISAGVANWLVTSTGAMCTIACCGSIVNSSGATEYGIVPAGHMGTVNTTVKINGSTIGKITKRTYGGHLDVAFVTLNSTTSYTVSQLLSNSYYISAWGTVGSVGTVYTMHGMSSGYVTGTVNDTSFSFTTTSNSYYDMIRMKMTGHPGDSGAPLIQHIGAGGYAKIIRFFTSGDSTYSNFSKFSVFRIAYGFTLT